MIFYIFFQGGLNWHKVCLYTVHEVHAENRVLLYIAHNVNILAMFIMAYF